MRTTTKIPTARTTMTSFFDTTTNLWLDALLAGKGVISTTMMTTATMTTKSRGDFDDDDTRTTTKTPTARTTSTSFLTRQPTNGRMHSWQGAGVI